ncbi:MAG: hypothetical protein WA090_09795 [Candidatus Nanopelagicaceae bacterium]
MRLKLNHAMMDALHRRDQVCRHEAHQILDGLNYFVDAMNYCLKVGQLKAFHLKNVLMLNLHWRGGTMDVNP